MRVRLSTYDAILEAGFQLFNDGKNASLAEIAEHAGVGRATLHRHFKSREDLISAMAYRAHEELNEAVEHAVLDANSYTDGLRLALNAIIPLGDRQWFLAHENLDGDEELANIYAEEQHELLVDIEKAKREGTFSKDIPTIWIAETYENLIYGAWKMVREQHATPSQAADLAWRTLTTGLKS